MSEESTVVYFYDEELRRISSDQLTELTSQGELLLQQQQQLDEIRQIGVAVLVLLGAVLGAMIFRHLRK